MTFVNALKKWFYTNGTTVGTTTSRIPLLDTNGNPIGSNTMQNISSLLGGLLTKAGEAQDIRTGDLNDFTTAGGYMIRYGTYGDVLNTPFRGHAYMIVMGSGETAMQLYISMFNRMAFRAKAATGWGAWNEIPPFSVIDENATFIAQKRVVNAAVDIDTLITPWYNYSASGSTAKDDYTGTFPTGVENSGFELQIAQVGGRIHQFYYESGNVSRYFRRVKNYDNDAWGAWYVYSGTAQS